MVGLAGHLDSLLRSGEDIDAAGQVGQRVGLGDLTAQEYSAGGVDVDGRLVGDALLFGSDILNTGKHMILVEEDCVAVGVRAAGVPVYESTVAVNAEGVFTLEESLLIVVLTEVVMRLVDRTTLYRTGKITVEISVVVVGGYTAESLDA